MEVLHQLDQTMAADRGLAPRESVSTAAAILRLEEGRDLYLAHVRRSRVTGGASAKTKQRYDAVFDKFLPFAEKIGVVSWNGVDKPVLEAYSSWLEDEDYAWATLYLELTTLKQCHKFLIERKHLPASQAFALSLKRRQDTTTYCYTRQEVEAMLNWCQKEETLHWLGDVITALITTGLRISELADLRWSNLSNDKKRIEIVDNSMHGSLSQREAAQTTKGRRTRVLPVHDRLRTVLDKLSARPHADGRIFRAMNGGILRPDKIRLVLIRDVLQPLGEKFPAKGPGGSFQDGRLHSFRHYFCSICANENVAEQMLMKWLGHRDSHMVKRYYHQHDEEARQQINRIKIL